MVVQSPQPGGPRSIRAGLSMEQRERVVERWPGRGPEEAAARLRDRPGLAWLDSALAHPTLGRWSIVASDPRWTLRARGRRLVHEQPAGARRWSGDPIATLAAAVEAEDVRDGSAGRDLPFVGGAIGYLGFELARHIERLPATTSDDVGAPELALGWYDAALVWDGVAGAGWLAGSAAAVERLRERLRGPLPPPAAEALARASGLRSNFEREAYLLAVQRARRYIEAGDIYQVNLSQRFSARVAMPGFDLYHRLRVVSPAPFAAYLRAPGVEVLSSCPERLLSVEGERLETRPMKGTRPRGATPGEDARLAEELRGSAKDAAEHVMIVDLERNDLGRVAQVGSVAVPSFRQMESYEQVHHLTSVVVARRRRDAGLAELLRAVFPGGSVTGAPKIRALEIIDELEPTVRGVYTGAIGYLSAHGRIDLNTAIRTITLAGGVAHMHVGGAVVYDSDPEREYVETLDKGRGMARALGVQLPDELPAATATAAYALAP
ncbi:MAG: aminodeoxychorismate synthase component I [Dehalococcoidia bacterium]|nr:aminodeoxychorismate synthase component I [Dehalococcoidia bacterium]